MAPIARRGRAVAFITMGLSVATVAGVPAAELLGSALGWHSAYALVALIGLTAGTMLWYLMPHMTEMKPTNPLVELGRSEEHTSELQSRGHLVCRLLLEKKKKKIQKQ